MEKLQKQESNRTYKHKAGLNLLFYYSSGQTHLTLH